MENQLAIQLRIMSTGMEKIGEASSAINTLDKNISTAGSSSGGLSKFGLSLQSTGSRINVLGQRMTWMVTVPLVAFGKAAIDTYLEIEKAWVGLEKVFSGTADDLSYLQSVAGELSNKFGRPVEDIITIMTEFSKAGVTSKDDLGNLSKTVSETAIVFDVDMTDALSGVKSVMMGFGLSASETGDALAALNIIADKTTASESGILDVFNRAAGVARNAGFSIVELASSQAVFEKNAIPAGRAGNAMKSILVSLTKQSNLAKDQFRDLGVDMDSTGWRTANAGDKLSILSQEFLKVRQSGDKTKLADFNEALASLVGKFQANNLNVLLEDMSYQFDNNAETVSQFGLGLEVSADAVQNMAFKQQQLDTVMGSSPQKMAQLEQQYRNMTAQIGEKLLPIKVKLMETLIQLLDKFNNLSPAQQDMIIKFTAIVAALGPVLAFLGLLITVLGFLLSTVGLVIVGVVAWFTMWYLSFKNWIEKMKELPKQWEEMKTYIFNLFVSIGEWLFSKWEEIKQTFWNALTGIWNTIKDIWNSIVAYVKGDLWRDLGFAIAALITLWVLLPIIIVQKIGQLGKYLWDNIFVPAGNWLVTNIPKIIDSILEFFKKLPGRIKDALASLGEFLWEKFNQAKDFVVNKLPDMIDKIIQFFKDLPGKIADAVKNLGSVLWEKFKEGLEFVKRKAKEFWEGASSGMKWAAEKVGLTFAKGGIVPQVYAASGYLTQGRDTVSAMLSPGEMVLNRSQQSNLFDMISGRKQMQTAGGATVNINVGTMVASRGEQREFARKIKELLEEDSNRY
jgi:TP901 family phage tail tape measure protein